jgi:hypothetical protein
VGGFTSASSGILTDVIRADVLLQSLIGEPLTTVRAQPNTVLSVAGSDVLVATSRSPQGQPVPIAWVQAALDRLAVGETVSIRPSSVGYRSAFLGAVLRALPQIDVMDGSPPTARLDPAADVSDSVLAELERRLGMWADLLDQGGPERVAHGAVRSLGIYGGASGIWTDTTRTRGVGDSASVTVGVLHTGRHYPDDLSETALLYHYPETDRRPGRDESEIDATKAAAVLRLPVFVVLQEANLRTIRKGWVVTWDDDEKLFLIEFGPSAARVPRGDAVDSDPFEPFEDHKKVIRQTRGRPNQQRFKVQVIQRYGGHCSLCPIGAIELINGGRTSSRTPMAARATHGTASRSALTITLP